MKAQSKPWDCCNSSRKLESTTRPLMYAREYFRTIFSLTVHIYQDIQSALRNSIHLIKRNRISPALLQNSLTQPSYTSVLRDTPVAPGVNTSASGSLRLETQVWNDIANLIAKLSPTPVSAQPITA